MFNKEDTVSNELKYKIYLSIFLFIIMGLTGIVVEVLYTGYGTLIKSIIDNGFSFETIATKGNSEGSTSIFTPLLYGWSFLPYMFLYPLLMKILPSKQSIGKLNFSKNEDIKHLFFKILRWVIYALCFMLLEFIVGLLSRSLGYVWWDYSHLPLNVMGIITFVMFPAWLLVAIAGEFFYNRLIQLFDIIFYPDGYNKFLINTSSFMIDLKEKEREKWINRQAKGGK